MYDVMLDEAKMWLDEPPKRKLESPPHFPPAPMEEDSDDDEVDPVAEEKYYRQVVESGGFDVDLFIQPFGGIIPCGCSDYQPLFGKVALHCYNIDKGTNLQYKTLTKCNVEITSLFTFYITLEATDPVDNSLITFQTSVTDAVKKNKANMRMFTEVCRIKPEVPGNGGTSATWWPDDDIDDEYKCDLPDWLQEDALTGRDKLQFYEVKEWEFENNKWLYLYAEFAWFSETISCLSSPLELMSVVVQTNEDIASSMKLQSRNAVFYMTFKVHGGPNRRGIVRKTSDGDPEHILLEARSWIDK